MVRSIFSSHNLGKHGAQQLLGKPGAQQLGFRLAIYIHACMVYFWMMHLNFSLSAGSVLASCAGIGQGGTLGGIERGFSLGGVERGLSLGGVERGSALGDRQ